MKTIKINIDFSNLLEQLTYEKFALSDLLSFILKDGIDINSESYKKLYQQYLEINTKYELVKQDLVKLYNLNQPWRLNFETGEVEFLNERFQQ